MNGEFLRQRRIETGLSQAAVGEMLGYSTQTISLWESGKSEPSMIIWGKYASILDIDLEGLILQVRKRENNYCGTNKFNVEQFAKNIRLLRKQKGLTQAALAKKINISVNTIIRFEKGVSLPDFSQFVIICNFYHLKFDALYFGLMDLPKPTPFYKKKYFIPIFIPIVVVVTVGGTTGSAIAIAKGVERRNKINNTPSISISSSESEIIVSSDSSSSEHSEANSESWTDIEGTMKYGSYPQTHVMDESLITILDSLSTTNEVGYYEYEGNYYEKVIPKDLGEKYKYYYRYFDNGEMIEVDGRHYWFKVEPIIWDYFEESETSYKLMSHSLLNFTKYANGAATYEESVLRYFLNNDFYQKAFFFEEQKPILTEVDNSPYRDDISEEVTNNTVDQVFAPSVNEVMSLTLEKRRIITSEYARSQGYVMEDNTANYWTRNVFHTYCQSIYAFDALDAASGCYGEAYNGLIAIRPMVVINK